ncbi:SNF2 family N-terminal domain-containing protein [Hypoxylon trugodes]|uniref:SNF2 family N-terminal domain-containing protein n=1 Tax=Hypoxylon trugodes TaxID=326681 RepID=UPI002196FBC6|nr:SNF2 family N-terminal domain-containing protein [Hypoxylon trugodes]KAI1387873.1 SNF2 family N-terminal domain-containing protein [Hypoxylon trugodes]
MSSANLGSTVGIGLNNVSVEDLRQTSNTTSYEVCFGMLCDIQVQLIPVVNRRKPIPSGSETEDISAVKLVFSEDRCDIVNSLEIVIGTINKKTHIALSKLTSIKQIYFSGCIKPTYHDNRISTTTKSPSISSPIATTSADFSIFGPRAIAEQLAKELSRYRLFLQHPTPLPDSVPYENPQYLSIAGISFSNGSILPAIKGIDESEETPDTPSSLEENEQLTDLNYVLDHLPQHNYLTQIKIDQRISTPLLSHQKEGVDFILRRERPATANLRSLWKLSGLDQDIQLYRHIITGSTSDAPDDAPGGILADAMGVGKTLTMIASIASAPTATIQSTTEPGNFQSQAINSTLILVPSPLILDGWIEEIEKHVIPGAFCYYKYHGPNRYLPASLNMPYNIVLTTYGTLVADFRRGGGILYSFKWYRLVLDEAHFIRNWPTKQFKAVMQLDAVIRWCMTGTPIQNRLEDLASLIRFLRVPILQDPSEFRRHIIGRKKTASGLVKPNFEKLRLLLGSICLRRNTSVLSLLGVNFTTCRIDLSSEEQQTYNGLALDCKSSIDKAISCENVRGSAKNPILKALLKMRIFCNLGLDIGTNLTTSEGLNGASGPRQQKIDTECIYCESRSSTVFDSESCSPIDNPELICTQCVSRLEHEVAEKRSVNSRSGRDDNAASLERYRFPKTHKPRPTASIRRKYSSKLKALLENIKMQDEEKSVVFSSWIRSLDSVADLLTEHGISHRRIDGSLPTAQRQRMLFEFRNPSVKVLLMTLGTGAAGLNQLSIASRLHLLEPQWNPSVESQAIGRVVRLDQKKEVTVIRYVTKFTIEESVEDRQAFKLRLAVAGGLQSSNSDHTERIQGLRELGKAIQSQLKSSS